MDHKDNDCLLIAILSHGELGFLHSKDTHYKLEAITSYFSADRCPSLAGKPKLFFIQACQGDNLDGGAVMRREATETDSNGYQSMSYTIPVHADFLIAYSTIPGNYISLTFILKQKKGLSPSPLCFMILVHPFFKAIISRFITKLHSAHSYNIENYYIHTHTKK